MYFRSLDVITVLYTIKALDKLPANQSAFFIAEAGSGMRALIGLDTKKSVTNSNPSSKSNM